MESSSEELLLKFLENKNGAPKPVDSPSLNEDSPKTGDDSSITPELEVIQFDLCPIELHLKENTMGMTVTSGSVAIRKDNNNLIGISIGGGSPLCPCLYIVQIFDNTAAARDGTLQSGDELVSVNGQSVKGKTKVEVAKMIQAAKEEVVINYNKLHADPKQGKSLDIIMKKMKHRLVENMSSSTADALGLSRAILCNDTLVKKMQELQDTEVMYRGLVDHCKRMLQAHMELQQAIKAMGEVFSGIAVREPQERASEAFRLFGEQHRNIEKAGMEMVKKVKPVLSDVGTYLYKAIPDTRLTVKKYADAKFEYLAYCLKVKEMDDEECSYAALQEPLYRVETGNYEYRLILRCRQLARARFAKLRADVLVKMELLDNKHVQSLGGHLVKIIHGLSELHSKTFELCSGPQLFPVEVDLSNSAFQYKSTTPLAQDNYEDDNDDKEVEEGEEIIEMKNKLIEDEPTEMLLPDLPGDVQNEPNYDQMDNWSRLSSLCIENPQFKPLLSDID
ncbi:unnamed protein product [Phyllotreta striolata]|uniref:PRKCA-binding protein n=1 Tax=Phyllotreta striolata TaxID=444603 RepID=A0A9N9THR5_PHYSR|nr:unnamed protein product [Phyllotreta striolata]